MTRKIHVPFETDGKTEDVVVEMPDTGESDEALASEALSYLETLAENGQLEVEDHPEKKPAAATHKLTRNPDGTRSLKRMRYSGI